MYLSFKDGYTKIDNDFFDLINFNLTKIKAKLDQTIIKFLGS